MITVETLRIEKFRQQRAQLTEALLAALQDDAYEDAATLLEKVVQKGATTPYLWYCRTFFRELPEAVIEKRPLLIAGMVILHSFGHRPDQAEEWLARLRTLLPSAPDTQFTIDSLLAYLALQMPEVNRGRLLPLLHRTAKSVKDGKIRPMHCTLTANRPSVFNGMFDLSRYRKNFHKLRQPLKGMLALVYDDSALAAVDIIQAEIAYQQSNLIEAFSLASSVVNLLNHTEDGTDMLFAAMFILLEVLIATGRIDACEAAVLNIQDKVVEMGAFHLLPNVKVLQVWIWLYTGGRERLEHWLVYEAPDENNDYTRLDNFIYLGKVRVYLTVGQPMMALGLCERLRPMLDEREQPMQVCELNILLAIIYAQIGSHEQAFVCLDRSLALGEKYGYYRLFADEGVLLYALLQRYARARKPAKTSFFAAMLKLTNEVAVLYPNYLKQSEVAPLQLTPKQINVLHLASKHYTNPQIAAQMHISRNAVTGYFRRIFAALGVSSRHQAVEVARRRGFLS